MITCKFYEKWAGAPAEIPVIPGLLASLAQQKKQDRSLPRLINHIIETVMRSFDQDDTLYGIFMLLNYSRGSNISPFAATHDYCVKVIDYRPDEGAIELNISPIYRLGPDYPDHYEAMKGKTLRDDAVVGLLTQKLNGSGQDSEEQFLLGIDAGVAFSDAHISHNKTLLLKLSESKEGLVAVLTCENQTTSKIFPWDNFHSP